VSFAKVWVPCKELFSSSRWCAAAGNNQAANQEEDDKPGRRHAVTTNAATAGLPNTQNASSATKPAVVAGQRRKVAERSGLGGVDTPDTNRAVGGSDRILRR
jgi:casein kinase I family protein HRR25